MEKLDATGHNAMIGDDNINFDLQLETFGVDMGALKEPPIERVFQAWVKDWVEEAQQKNDCVAKAQLLAKYKVLSSVIPTQGNHFRFGNKMWSSIGGEVIDGSLLMFVLMLKMIMRCSHWRLHVN